MLTEPLGPNALSLPLSRLYSRAVRVRNRLYNRFPRLSRPAPVPVISIGGIHAGGTGKTPLALLTGLQISRASRPVIFLTRGYGRKSGRPLVVAPGGQCAWETTGDEPALLHRTVPGSWLAVGADRAAVLAEAAGRAGPGAVAVMDDGFQHRRLRRDLDIVCLPPDPFGDHLIPAGTLREPPDALRRAGVACIIGPQSALHMMRETAGTVRSTFGVTSVFVLISRPDGWRRMHTGEYADRPPLRHPVVMTGIARPARFLDMVTASGVDPSAVRFFPDHHRFTESDITGEPACFTGGIVTTEKDIVKLERLNLVKRPEIWYLKLKLSFDTAEAEHNFNGIVVKKAIPTKAEEV